MQNPSSLSRFIVVAGIAALSFAGCSGNGSQFSPAAAPVASTQTTTMQPEAVNEPHVTMFSGNCIIIYAETASGNWEYYYRPPNCDPAEGTYTGGALNANTKDWLVGESSASLNAIGVLNSKGKQVGTLTGLTGNPVGIAIDSKGDVLATDYPSNAISEYNPGATNPSATYSDENLSSLRYVAVDEKDNVYVSGQSAGSGGLEVDELRGSAFIPIETIGGNVGAGIAVSLKTKTLWVCDEGDGTSGTISGYTIPGFKRRMQIDYSGDDTGIAVSPSGTEVYAVNNVPDGSQFKVNVNVYDAKTGKQVSSTPSIRTSAKVVGVSNRR